MSAFIFTCPTTKLNVQHWSENDEDISESEYEGISCLACSRLDFINRKTGELLGKALDAGPTSSGFPRSTPIRRQASLRRLDGR